MNPNKARRAEAKKHRKQKSVSISPTMDVAIIDDFLVLTDKNGWTPKFTTLDRQEWALLEHFVRREWQ